MLLTREEYEVMGFETVPAREFERYEKMAELAVERFTFGRVSSENITEANKYGVCELMDEYYFDKNPQVSNENRIVSSFTNEGYGETYVQAKQASADNVATLADKVLELLNVFFTKEQLYRGV